MSATAAKPIGRLTEVIDWDEPDPDGAEAYLWQDAEGFFYLGNEEDGSDARRVPLEGAMKWYVWRNEHWVDGFWGDISPLIAAAVAEMERLRQQAD